MNVLNDQVVSSMDLFVPKTSHGWSRALASSRRIHCPMVDCAVVMSEYSRSDLQLTHVQQSEVLAYPVYLETWVVKTKPSLFLSFSFNIGFRWEHGREARSHSAPESVPSALWSLTPAWSSSVSINWERSQWPLCLRCLMLQNRV